MQVLCQAELQPRSGRGVYRRSGDGSLDLEARRIAPQTLQLVVVPRLLIEEMDDHVAVVEEYPVPVLLALPPIRLASVGGLQSELDLVDERLDVPGRRARGDEEEIGDDDEIRYIEQ